jgi:hypothetical protein
MLRRILIIVGLILGIAALVSAQEPDPFTQFATATIAATVATQPATSTPTATLDVTTDRLLFAPQVEVAFPAGVRFYIRVIARSEAIVSARLTLERANSAARTIDLDLATTATRTGNIEEFTDLEYIWQITSDEVPRFFETINFRWSIRTAEEVSTASGQFEFNDARLLWETARTSGDAMTVSLPLERGLTRLIDVMQPVADLLETNFGPLQPAAFIVYSSDIDPTGCEEGEDDATVAFTLSGIAIPCTEDDLATSIFAASELEVVRVGNYTQSDMQNALTAALFDRTYRALWAEQQVPEWFAFGLTRIIAPTSSVDLLAIAQDATRSNRLLSLSEMATVPDEATALRDWQAQSLAMTLYIADQIGYTALFDLAQALQTRELSTLYSQRSGQSINALMPAFRDWLFTTQAEGAFRASVYAEATHTPAPRPTQTPFPATRTPRPQPSETPIPTITLTPSPRPTSTPTASVTPRPPGSLATPTMLAPVVSTPAADSGAQTSIIAIFGIIIAILIIVFARVGRR